MSKKLLKKNGRLICSFDFPAAKVQQIFVIHKDLTIKMKFIPIFSGKALLLARLSDRTFEVGRRVAVSVSSKILQIFVHKKMTYASTHVIFLIIRFGYLTCAPWALKALPSRTM